MPEMGHDQHQSRIPIRKCSHNPSSLAELAQDPLKGIVGPDA